MVKQMHITFIQHSQLPTQPRRQLTQSALTVLLLDTPVANHGALEGRQQTSQSVSQGTSQGIAVHSDFTRGFTKGFTRDFT